MTNFIFKSQGTYKKLASKLEVIQAKLRHQRIEHSEILRSLHKLMVERNLVQQTLEYYEEKEETSPQTEHETPGILDGPTESSD